MIKCVVCGKIVKRTHSIQTTCLNPECKIELRVYRHFINYKKNPKKYIKKAKIYAKKNKNKIEKYRKEYYHRESVKLRNREYLNKYQRALSILRERHLKEFTEILNKQKRRKWVKNQEQNI